MNDFRHLLLRVKENDQTAYVEILSVYRPLLLKESIVNGAFDEDLYQELCLTLFHCIRKFSV